MQQQHPHAALQPSWVDAFPSVPDDVDDLTWPADPDDCEALALAKALSQEGPSAALSPLPGLPSQQLATTNDAQLNQFASAQFLDSAATAASHNGQLRAPLHERFLEHASAFHNSPAETAVPANYDLLSSILFDHPASPGHLTHPSNPSAQTSTSSHQPPSTNSTAPTTGGATPSTTTLTDLDTLLDNHLNAALVAAQLPKPRRNPSKPPAASPASFLAPPQTQPIAKPKRKKLRPKDTLNTLHAHLDTITTHIARLSLHNRWLQTRHQVLQKFVQDLDRYELLANQMQQDIALHRSDPSTPPRGAAIYQQWSPQQFVKYYGEHVRTLTRLLNTVEAGMGPPEPPALATTPAGCTPIHPSHGPMTPAAQAAMAELESANQMQIQTILFASHGRVDFIPKVITLLGQSGRLSLPEDQHWRNVVAGMELTEGQEDELLAMREMLLALVSRMEQEQEVAQAAIHQHGQPHQAAGAGDALEDMVHLEEHVVRRMAAIMRRHQGLLTLCTLFMAFRTLTPLQVARGVVHAYPLLAEPLLIMNAIHARRCLATNQQAVPILGPQPPPMATAYTLSDLLAGACGMPHHAPQAAG